MIRPAVVAIGRAWFGLTAAVVALGMVVQMVVTAGATGGRFDTAPARIANLLVFFTILSNLLLGVTTLLLAIAPGRSSTVFRVLRLDAVLGITVTGIVYHLVLAPLSDLTGVAWFADQLLHTAAPLLGVLGWLLFGPRGLVGRAVAAWSVLFPVLWLGFTLARGAVIGWYPYSFVDVTDLGYARVALNGVVVAVLFLVLAVGALAVDRLLLRRTTPADPAVGPTGSGAD
ncbi:Pr6Pr family membrane protein [Pseudonocardia sp. H11422]|uniref:Pr6Pr family membrane protein n=1 Tax=Pseudonocardia sp. H11422 TaxID=2835866 RepID=UPI001BDD96F6|nr:Pr6Pr family membrane protein [Pseudonocardia sp. H11422]